MDTIDPDGEIWADWNRAMAQMRHQAEQAIRKLEAAQSESQAQVVERQLALFRKLLAEIGPEIDAPMTTQ